MGWAATNLSNIRLAGSRITKNPEDVLLLLQTPSCKLLFFDNPFTGTGGKISLPLLYSGSEVTWLEVFK